MNKEKRESLWTITKEQMSKCAEEFTALAILPRGEVERLVMMLYTKREKS